MWSDPDDIETWSVSPRGAGWLFGSRVTAEVRHTSRFFPPPSLSFRCPLDMQFNHINGIKTIARAHQLVQEGYKYMFDNALVTVWSAPNYCYRCGNLASIMQVREDGKQVFKTYMAAEENETDPKNEAARRVSPGKWLCRCMGADEFPRTERRGYQRILYDVDSKHATFDIERRRRTRPCVAFAFCPRRPSVVSRSMYNIRSYRRNNALRPARGYTPSSRSAGRVLEWDYMPSTTKRESKKAPRPHSSPSDAFHRVGRSINHRS